MRSALRFVALLVGAMAIGPRALHAADYPDHPVRLIVPFAAGGPTDTIARILAGKLGDHLGKQFYVENQAGAGGNIGMGNAAHATPDGYTLLVVSSSFVVNPSLYAKISYDPERDFLPISLVADSPNVLVVNPQLPAKSVKELVDLVKANPGKYSFASPGAGTTPHLSGALLTLTAGLDLVHVPFSGAGPAAQAVAAGHTPIGFMALPPATPLVQGGQLRALAVTGKTRSPALPDVPTMTEAGFPGQEADTLQAVLAPAGTPKPITDLIYREVIKIVQEDDVKQKLATLGFEPVGNTPEEFATQIKAEIAKWRKVIRDSNICAE
ncbi:MAG: tripartite tricarboxylate transporter substrate binding protein [Xanthobacteraceae bacterium]|nr:tripartite tricarboxylate transporter substrate binding protein [Xanthobacteraceae bacterium]